MTKDIERRIANAQSTQDKRDSIMELIESLQATRDRVKGTVLANEVDRDLAEAYARLHDAEDEAFEACMAL